MQPLNIDKLITFLQGELNIPAESVQLALRQVENLPCMLPVALWQYGFVSLKQLDQIFAWIESDRLSIQ